MNIQLQVQGFEMTPAIDAHVRRQIDFNLANFQSHVISVDVYLRDINGPKGGEDKKALVCIRLASRIMVKVERTRQDLYVAISLAARQAKRAVKRSLSKHRHMEKLALRELRQFPQD
jgi:ribosomal subunit interface protein